MNCNLEYRIYPRNFDKKPKYVVILLHGYGSNEDDLISLAPDMDVLQDTVFISLQAPFAFEGGMGNAYQWYSLIDRSEDVIMAGFNQVYPILYQAIESIIKYYDINSNQIIIAGFSQGGMMTLNFGLTSNLKFAALLSFSGYFMDSGISYSQCANADTPIFLAHGDMDTVVPISSFKLAYSKLDSLGFKVMHHLSSGLAHGIDYGCIDAANDFLKNNLS